MNPDGYQTRRGDTPHRYNMPADLNQGARQHLRVGDCWCGGFTKPETDSERAERVTKEVEGEALAFVAEELRLLLQLEGLSRNLMLSGDKPALEQRTICAAIGRTLAALDRLREGE